MTLTRLLRGLAGLLLGAALAAQPAPKTVRVAAAADLKWALEEVRAAFAKERPDVQIAVTFGSSGQFYAQLAQKAPFDVFLSADLDYARKLAEQGLGLPGSTFTYGIGRLVLWLPTGSRLQPEKLGLSALLDPALRHLAMANPVHAPYGRAAEAALISAKLLPQLKPKLVLGENIAQAAQYVQTGAADAGLLALSLAMAPEMQRSGRYWLIPQALHPPLAQGGLILAWAREAEAAQAFRGFLLGPQGGAILARFGFERPN